MATVNETPTKSDAQKPENAPAKLDTQPAKSGTQDVNRASQETAPFRTSSSYFPSPSEFFTNPFAVMRRMHEDMDRMFSQALGAGNTGGTLEGNRTWSPVVEIKQQGSNLQVCAELPGMKPEEVHVEINEDALILQGERRQEQTSEEGRVHRTERSYGQFYRSIPLPEGANTDQASASFHDGVLEVTIPIARQEIKRRQIPISGKGSPADRDAGKSTTEKGLSDRTEKSMR